MNKWIIAEVPEAGPAVMDAQEVVMYFDDIKPEVMTQVVGLQNNNPEISFLTAIDTYLLDEEKCTQDEREFIMEQLVNYVKLTNVSDNELQPGAQPGQQDNGGVQPTITPNPGATPEPTKELTRGEKAAATRKANQEKNGGARRLTDGPAKKASTSKAIEEYQEKIDMLKILDSVEVLAIPSGISATNRNMLIEFQKEQEALVQKYIDQVKAS